MTETLKKEIEDLITKLNLNCTIDEFENKVNWYNISVSKKLSENFIDKYQNKVNWYNISVSQKLSEEFIEKYQDKVNWLIIFCNQKLSESFIEKYQNKIIFRIISYSQKLSEEFIEKYQDKVNWYNISVSQKLSLPFIEKHKDKLDVDIQMRKHHVNIEPIKEATEYAEIHNLKIEDGYLYAFREHDKNGCGMYNKTIVYKSGETYTDWHCDLDKTEESSFGLGIFPKGNTPVKVKLEDFGVYIPNHKYGKARVRKFTVL